MQTLWEDSLRIQISNHIERIFFQTRMKQRKIVIKCLHFAAVHVMIILLCGVNVQHTNPAAVRKSAVQYKEVNIMREGIHPTFYQAKVVCNCGNEFVTGSTKPEIHVEICSKCHSFYTGQQKAASARGRIEKFNRKYGVNNN